MKTAQTIENDLIENDKFGYKARKASYETASLVAIHQLIQSIFLFLCMDVNVAIPITSAPDKHSIAKLHILTPSLCPHSNLNTSLLTTMNVTNTTTLMAANTNRIQSSTPGLSPIPMMVYTKSVNVKPPKNTPAAMS